MVNLMKRLHRQEKGFTLVELMVVVVIIGVLVAIAIPIFNAVTATAEKSACHANQRTAEGAAMMFRADTDAFPATVGALETATPPFLAADEASCPTTGTFGAATVFDADGRLPAAPCDVHGSFRD